MKMRHLLIMSLLATYLISPQVLAESEDLVIGRADYPSWFALEAKIEAVNEATISAQTSGRVQSIEVDINDYVEKGDIIIQLRNKQQMATVAQAKAGLTQAQAASNDAQSQLRRATPLFKQGSLSQGEFDTIKTTAQSIAAQVKAARALLDQAQEQLSYTEIRAPYAGIVKARLVEVGETVNPGTPLMTGLSLNKLRAVAYLPQRFITQVNQQSDLKVAHNGKLLSTDKVTIFPFADANSHSFKIRVDVNSENAGLFPGMWVKLMVPMGTTSAIRIPKSAILRKGEVSYVYVKKASQYVLRQVRLGEQHLANTENRSQVSVDILAGLNDGDHIALDAQAILATQEI